MKRPPELPPRSALFLDIDGTLLDIAPRPDLVRVPPGLPELLSRLTAERDGAVALVSGRKLAQIDALFRPWRGAAAGLHGAERRRADGTCATSGDSPAERAAAAALDSMRPGLCHMAARWPGVWLEDKGRTLALHFRAVPDNEPEIRDAVGRLAGQSGGWLRPIAGKMVVELQPVMHGKNGAIAAFLAEPPFQGRLPVFLGDDATDEDGFAEVNRRSGLSIRIGEPGAATAAEYGLLSVAAALAWLAGEHREQAERGRDRTVSTTGG